jgi:hypothetical protein
MDWAKFIHRRLDLARPGTQPLVSPTLSIVRKHITLSVYLKENTEIKLMG